MFKFLFKSFFFNFLKALLINENSEMQNYGKIFFAKFFHFSNLVFDLFFSNIIEFLNLMEASKWLIEAGYSQYVHAFLSI